MDDTKKVLLIVVDALSSRHVRSGFEEGRLPNFQRLAEIGEMHDECISIFPSITPAATASIITGRYPCDHCIAGAFFYDTDEDHVKYFGDDIWAILRKGCSEFFNDFLVHLNRDMLAAKTVFERAEEAGKKAAVINYLIMKGVKKHQVDVPWLLRLFPGVPWHEEVFGPDLLCLGDLVSAQPRKDDKELSAPGGPFNRFGFQDDSTAAFLLKLAKRDAWRNLNVAYFPDNDYDSHSDGPTSAIKTLENVDSHLGELFDACDGVKSLLKSTTILVTGDHSQSDLVADEAARAIALDELLAQFSLVPAGEKWSNDDQLMVCPNMRAAQIYLRRELWNRLDEIVNCLLSDHRVDQVIWRVPGNENDGGDGNEHRHHVASKHGDRLVFWRATEDDSQCSDDFGNHWNWNGSLSPVDATLSNRRIQYGDYPNAFERIATSFVNRTGGDLWVTARVGHEFKLPGVSVHAAGSHGSLHALDSLSPMIMAGAPDGISLPRSLRTIDTANLCLRILGVSSD